MAIVEALIEREIVVEDALGNFALAGSSFSEGQSQVRSILPDMGGIHFRPAAKPVPMFTRPGEPEAEPAGDLAAFAFPEVSDDLRSVSQVVPVQVEESALADLQGIPGIRVWPSSPITFFQTDCSPFRPAVDVSVIQSRLGVDRVWADGVQGKGVVVAILDEGIDGSTYAISGGYSREGAQAPGTAAVTSHGSMCAADVLISAPEAQLHDYPFMVPSSGGALVMLNAVLDQRRRDGSPYIVSNSWGFYGVPDRSQMPQHEVWDINHPLHRKIREVVTSGATVVFAAGNCGSPCAAGNCDESSIGPGQSIHGSNSLTEVITVAAVNSVGERIGYSSQGPGMFDQQKPDVAGFSHFFGNFGPGRPAGQTPRSKFDNGTSAACPLVAGVAALLLCARPGLSPSAVRAAITGTARGSGWDPEVGYGIVDAEASYRSLP